MLALSRRLAATRAGPGVGEEDVDRADLALDALDQGDDRRLVRDVELHAEATDLVTDGLGRRAVAVGDDHRTGPACHPTAGHGRADAPAPTRDDRYPIRDLHGRAP